MILMDNYLINHLTKKMNKINIEVIKQFKEAFKYRKEADKESLEIYLNEKKKLVFNWN